MGCWPGVWAIGTVALFTTKVMLLLASLSSHPLAVLRLAFAKTTSQGIAVGCRALALQYGLSPVGMSTVQVMIGEL